MKKAIIFLSVLVMLLFITGCSQPTQAIIQTSVITETKTLPATTIVNTITVIKVIDPITGNAYVIKQDSVGMANADANVQGYINGLDAHWIGLVLNGDSIEHQFNIVVAPYSSNTVSPAPNGIADWVTISNNKLVDGVLTVEPMSAASLYMTLNVPSGVQLPQEWGFTVGIKDVDAGNVGVVNPVRWIVNMSQPVSFP